MYVYFSTLSWIILFWSHAQWFGIVNENPFVKISKYQTKVAFSIIGIIQEKRRKYLMYYSILIMMMQTCPKFEQYSYELETSWIYWNFHNIIMFLIFSYNGDIWLNVIQEANIFSPILVWGQTVSMKKFTGKSFFYYLNSETSIYQ